MAWRAERSGVLQGWRVRVWLSDIAGEGAIGRWAGPSLAYSLLLSTSLSLDLGTRISDV